MLFHDLGSALQVFADMLAGGVARGVAIDMVLRSGTGCARKGARTEIYILQLFPSHSQGTRKQDFRRGAEKRASLSIDIFITGDRPKRK